MHQLTLLSVVVAVLAALPTAQAGIYTKNSPVLQLDARSYEQLIAKSNHTTVRFTVTPSTPTTWLFRKAERKR